MPRRRPFGSVYRRRIRVAGPTGEARRRFKPGWYIRIRAKGRDVRRYGGPDRKTALDYLALLQRETERFELLGELPPNELTLAAFAPIYRKHCARTMTKAGVDRRESLLRSAILPALKAKKLQDVTPQDIHRLLISHPHWSGASRNRALTALSSIYRHAIDLGFVTENPTKGIRRSPEPPTPLPLVSLRDQDRLVEACPAPLRPLVIAALETGCRQGELLALEWADVDFEGSCVRIRRNKSGRQHIVYMSAKLRLMLLERSRARVLPMSGPDLVFPGMLGTNGRLKIAIYRQYKKAAAAAGHPNLRFHDTRHIVAINLIRLGLDLPAVQQTLGHKSLASTLRYAMYSDGTAAARAARALDRMRAEQDR